MHNNYKSALFLHAFGFYLLLLEVSVGVLEKKRK